MNLDMNTIYMVTGNGIAPRRDVYLGDYHLMEVKSVTTDDSGKYVKSVDFGILMKPRGICDLEGLRFAEISRYEYEKLLNGKEL